MGIGFCYDFIVTGDDLFFELGKVVVSSTSGQVLIILIVIYGSIRFGAVLNSMHRLSVISESGAISF